jgi:hypothetical protein
MTATHGHVQAVKLLKRANFSSENCTVAKVIADITSLNKLYVVDFGGSLDPLEPVLLVELHTMWHHLEP